MRDQKPNMRAGLRGAGSLLRTQNRTPLTARDLRERRLWFFWPALFLIPVLFFLVVETGLRWLGTGYPAEFLVPDMDNPGLVVDNYRFAWRFFPRSLARSPQPILVSKNKPPGTMRIIVFGGSAAMGDPEPAYGLPRLLEVLLKSRFPGYDFEVINAAVTAINSHVVLPIARELRHLDADAWVVYTGNNEVHGPFGPGTIFGGSETPLWAIRAVLALQRTKIGQLFASWETRVTDSSRPKTWGGMKMFLEHQIPHDHPGLERVYANYRENLRDILSAASHAGTPVVISTVVTNLKDLPPFMSLHRDGLPDAVLKQWNSFFQLGIQAQSRGDLRKALVAFKQAADIDAEYAELEYRQGQCYLQLGDAHKAAEKFRLARDHDALRFRADTTINDIIRSTAHAHRDDNVIFVDADEELARQVPDKIIGNELLHEHVHLNFTGNYQLARLLAERLAETLGLSAKSGGNHPQAWPSEETSADLLGLTPYHRLLITREMRGRLNAPPFNRQINHSTRDENLRAAAADLSAALTPEVVGRTTARFQQQIAKRPSDRILREQFAVLLETVGDLDGAIEQYRQITSHLSHHPEAFVRLGVLLNRIGKWQDAEQTLRTALALRPDYATAASWLGICLVRQGRYAEAHEQFRKTVELQPAFAEAWLNWGLVLANRDDPAGALEKYQAAVAADEDYLPAHDRLGKTYIAAGDPDAALPHYAAVVRLKPKDPVAHLNLGLLYLKMGNRHVDATRHLKRTLELDPGNHYAQQGLSKLGSLP